MTQQLLLSSSTFCLNKVNDFVSLFPLLSPFLSLLLLQRWLRNSIRHGWLIFLPGWTLSQKIACCFFPFSFFKWESAWFFEEKDRIFFSTSNSTPPPQVMKTTLFQMSSRKCRSPVSKRNWEHQEKVLFSSRCYSRSNFHSYSSLFKEKEEEV